MYEIFNPEFPGLEPPNPGISGLRNMSGIPGFGIPGLESLVGMLNELYQCLTSRQLFQPNQTFHRRRIQHGNSLEPNFTGDE
jgi:hypothetical protein